MMTDRNKNQVLFVLLGIAFFITSGILGHMAYNIYFNPGWNAPAIQRDAKYFINNAIYLIGFLLFIVGGIVSFAAALSPKWEGRILEENAKPDAFKCLKCNYDLRRMKLANTASCPECGCKIEDAQIKAIATKRSRK